MRVLKVGNTSFISPRLGRSWLGPGHEVAIFRLGRPRSRFLASC